MEVTVEGIDTLNGVQTGRIRVAVLNADRTIVLVNDGEDVAVIYLTLDQRRALVDALSEGIE
jgi:hypothetical protein